MSASEAVQWSGGFIYSILAPKPAGKKLPEKMWLHCSSWNPSQM